MDPIAIVVVVLVVVLVIAAGLSLLTVRSQTTRIDERLERVTYQNRVIVRGTALDEELSKGINERVVLPWLRRMHGYLVGMTPANVMETTRQRIDRAGNPPGLKVATFLPVWYVGILVGVVGFVLIMMLWSQAPLLNRVLFGGIVLVLGVVGPNYWLDGKIKARQHKIRRTLPDIIDLLVVSTEAGTGLDGALSVVIKRKGGALPEEFDRLLTEVRLGKSRQRAWEDMGNRVDVQDLSMLISALRQAEQLGVSIANTLRTQADALRTRRSIQVRQIAATLSLRMLFPLIFCILPSLFVVVLGPGFLSISGGLGAVFG
jgi:tight adherence protein C